MPFVLFAISEEAKHDFRISRMITVLANLVQDNSYLDLDYYHRNLIQ